MIEQANLSQFSKIMEIYAQARTFMAQTGRYLISRIEAHA